MPPLRGSEGGGAKTPGFHKYLEMETGIQVEALNPFGNLQFNEKIFDSNYLAYSSSQSGVAVGLALRYIGDK